MVIERTPIGSSWAATGAVRINGVGYGHSLYSGDMHASYDLERKCQTFTATVGLIDSSVDTTQVGQFEVWGDDHLLASQRVPFAQAAALDVNIGGVLRLRITGVLAKPWKASADTAFGDPMVHCSQPLTATS